MDIKKWFSKNASTQTKTLQRYIVVLNVMCLWNLHYHYIIFLFMYFYSITYLKRIFLKKYLHQNISFIVILNVFLPIVPLQESFNDKYKNWMFNPYIAFTYQIAYNFRFRKKRWQNWCPTLWNQQRKSIQSSICSDSLPGQFLWMTQQQPCFPYFQI